MAQVQELHVVQVLGQMQVLLLILIARLHYVALVIIAMVRVRGQHAVREAGQMQAHLSLLIVQQLCVVQDTIVQMVFEMLVALVLGVLLGEQQAHHVLKRSVAQDTIAMAQVLKLLVVQVRG